MTKRIWKGWGEEWEYRGKRTWIQERRYQSLINDGLKPYQAKHFVFYNFSSAYMRRFRSAIRRGESGRSQASAWALWRKLYDEAIAKSRRGDRGGYIPPPKQYNPNKPHKKMNPDGSIDYSHSREYERGRRSKSKGTTTTKPQSSGDVNSWISQLEQSIRNTNDPQRKEQFRGQIVRLKNYLENKEQK